MQELQAPPISGDPKAVEIMRVWGGPELAQQIVLRTIWSEPEAWGLLLADLARHAAKAYSREGISEKTALQKIAQVFDLEIASPTDDPQALQTPT